MAELPPNPPPDDIVPEKIVAQTEKRWVLIIAAMLAVMMVVTVPTGVGGALHPPSIIEIVNPPRLHRHSGFVVRNPGDTTEPDGSATVRLIGEQYDFVPHCVGVPAETPVKFQLASADVVNRLLLPDANVNTMAVPGFVAEVHARFTQTSAYAMPCHEFCGLGHHAMWARAIVVPKERFRAQGPMERTRCVAE